MQTPIPSKPKKKKIIFKRLIIVIVLIIILIAFIFIYYYTKNYDVKKQGKSVLNTTITSIKKDIRNVWDDIGDIIYKEQTIPLQYAKYQIKDEILDINVPEDCDNIDKVNLNNKECMC